MKKTKKIISLLLLGATLLFVNNIPTDEDSSSKIQFLQIGKITVQSYSGVDVGKAD
ncbi:MULTISPECIES: hypothetical protein [unclassified Streptococcus]|uniref:hypothetical protein n=1 Tax=unclassified Streptococcus TaxID=2608887 RepID=UPI00142F5F0C|nr:MULTISPECIES: hypothetical protein [unclassified Streptococcus]MBF0786906.1 hypothetical protein [Streptococcus sp. 19428wC2_LYSM12]MCQ9212682.1 hypothetical protein [Streptococcus sp. B01]MCQ9214023.1 hypothetical protein [Streptococcus sp. O1]